MELDLGPEIAQFRAELRDWIAAEAPEALAGLTDWNMPMTAGGGRGARLAAAEAHPAYAEWVAKMAARRLICPQWPEEFGGQGMDAVRLAVLNEECYRAGVPRVTRGMGEALVGPSVIVHGTPEQRAYFLPRIISGADRVLPGLLRAGPRLGPGRRADARRGGGGRGRHHRAEGLDVGRRPGQPDVPAVPDRPRRAQARRALLRADRLHRPRLSLFAVDGSAAGLRRTTLPTLDQTRKLARLEFAGATGALIGSPGDAVAVLDRTLDVAAIALAAEQLGGAQRALEQAVAYAKMRHQFGRPIGSFQAIKHRCADLLLEVESLRSAVGYAAAAVAADSPEIPVLASLLKAYASETYFHVAAENIQIHGGIAFTWEHDAHLYFKRAKSSELFLGDGGYHRERLAARIGL